MQYHFTKEFYKGVYSSHQKALEAIRRKGLTLLEVEGKTALNTADYTVLLKDRLRSIRANEGKLEINKSEPVNQDRLNQGENKVKFNVKNSPQVKSEVKLDLTPQVKFNLAWHQRLSRSIVHFLSNSIRIYSRQTYCICSFGWSISHTN